MKTSTFKPFSFEDSDSEKEMEDVSDLKNEITRLKAKLSRAERKLVVLATAAERIHSMINPVLTQHKIAIKMVKGLKIKESNAFLADNKTVLAKVIDIGNKAQATFAGSFPMLATMLFFIRRTAVPRQNSMNGEKEMETSLFKQTMLNVIRAAGQFVD